MWTSDMHNIYLLLFAFWPSFSFNISTFLCCVNTYRIWIVSNRRLFQFCTKTFANWSNAIGHGNLLLTPCSTTSRWFGYVEVLMEMFDYILMLLKPRSIWICMGASSFSNISVFGNNILFIVRTPSLRMSLCSFTAIQPVMVILRGLDKYNDIAATLLTRNPSLTVENKYSGS